MANCGCNCSPCTCPSSTGDGCLPDLCVPRPCFFDGQLINADDLNAAAVYSRTRDLGLGRFAAGWGIYGGFVVTHAPGVPAAYLGSEPEITPNPQILAGTTLAVSPGFAIDARGRQLVLCAPMIVDVAALVAQAPTAPESKSCSDWFRDTGVTIPNCNPQNPPIVAAEYVLVAEFVETPARPTPQFSGGGACDPAPTCEFSRKLEGVKLSLLPSAALSESTFFTGCVEAIDAQIGDPPEGGPALVRWFDAVNSALSAFCCSRPIVPLAKILVTANAGSLKPQNLPSAPTYVIIDDSFPLRRSTPSHSLFALLQLSREPLPPGPVAIGRVFKQGGTTWKYSAKRGFAGDTLPSPVSNVFTLTLDEAIEHPRRVVTVSTESQDPNQPSILSVLATGSSQELQIAYNNVEPVTFHVVVHAVPGSK